MVKFLPFSMSGQLRKFFDISGIAFTITEIGIGAVRGEVGIMFKKVLATLSTVTVTNKKRPDGRDRLYA